MHILYNLLGGLGQYPMINFMNIYFTKHTNINTSGLKVNSLKTVKVGYDTKGVQAKVRLCTKSIISRHLVLRTF